MTVIVIVVGRWSKTTIEMLNKTRTTPRTETYRIFDIFVNKSLMKNYLITVIIRKKLIICVPPDAMQYRYCGFHTIKLISSEFAGFSL